jgi:hypothetical protein
MSVISLKINIDLIEQARLYPGQKGRYLDAILYLNDTPDQFGNYGMIVQGVSKEEKAQGVRGPILGNCKVMGQKSNQAPVQATQPLQLQPLQPTAPKTDKAAKPKMPANTTVDPEDLPF